MVRPASLLSITSLLVTMAISLVCSASPSPREPDILPPPSFDRTRVSDAFVEWVREREENGTDSLLTIELVGPKEGSSEDSTARGVFIFDRLAGTVWVEVDGGADLLEGGLWLIDNVLGTGGTIAPDPGDPWIFLGPMKLGPGSTAQTLHVPGGLDFEVDLVVVTRPGELPTEGGVLFGCAPLFSRLHARMLREGRSLESMAAEIAQMVERGRALFHEGTCAFPRTFPPEPGHEIPFPTEAELDDREAFLLSTVHACEFDLGAGGALDRFVALLTAGSLTPETIQCFQTIVREFEILCARPDRGQVVRLLRAIEATSSSLVE